MRKCIVISQKAIGKNDPNPLVGAALINAKGDLIGIDYHQAYGQAHAEAALLDSIEEVEPTDTLFVTLEPCNHFGKTPPCIDAIIKKRVKNVVIGTLDPNPIMQGKSVKILKEHGVHVRVGVLEKECQNLNRIFNYHILNQIPYIAIKIASSMDGRIALANSESQWITNALAREKGHFLRSQYQSIAIGKQTLLKDNPRLNNRFSSDARQPVRILFDSQAQVSFDSNWFKLKYSKQILVISDKAKNQTKIQQLEAEGVQIIKCVNQEIDQALLRQLYKAGVSSILVEGGARLIQSFLETDYPQAIHLFLSPMILGSDAKSWSYAKNLESLPNAETWEIEALNPYKNNLEILWTKKNNLLL